MNSAPKHSCLVRVVPGILPAIAFILIFLPASQSAFGGEAERSEKCARIGDAKVSKGIAKNLVAYAIKKYEIGDLVDEQAMKKARKEVYEFLKWKLANPLAICGQYITAGQAHFNKKYSDEAAAALLGFDLPKEKAGHSQFYLPPQLVDLQLKIKKTVAIPIAAQAIQAHTGIPAPISEILLGIYVEEEAKVLKRVGFNIPQEFDFPNGLLQTAIEAKRDPQGTKAKLQRVVDEASKGG